MMARTRPLRRPRFDGVAVVRSILFGICAAVLILTGAAALGAGVVVYASSKAKAAIVCALDSMTRQEAVDLARALRADLLAAHKEIETPALKPDEKKILLLRLDRRVRFADSIIICGGQP